MATALAEAGADVAVVDYEQQQLTESLAYIDALAHIRAGAREQR